MTARILAAGMVLFALSGCTLKQPDAQQRATLLVHKNREQEAIDVLREHLSRHPDAIAERRLLIRVIALTGDLAAAQREATALAERLRPGDPTPWIEMGHAFELNHRYDDALAMFDRAAAAAPKDAAGPREGGRRAAEWGEAELAEPRLIEALRRDPRDADSWHTLGLVRLKLGDHDGARQAYRSGLIADPSAIENRLGLATVAVADGDARAALEQYDALAAARPRLGDIQLGRAWALARLGRLTEAAAALERAEELGGSPRAIRAQRRALETLRAPAEVQDNR